MTSNQRNWTVYFAAIAVTALAAAAFLGAVGVTDENVFITLQLSARIAFVILLIVFVARPLQQMFATPFTAKLLRNRRLFGIAFAGVHTAHLGLIMYRARVNPGFDYLLAENASGMFTYLVILAMFVTSFNAVAKKLGARNWRILHKAGLYFLFAAFTQTQLPDSLDHLEDMNWLLIALIFAALVIRLTAYLARHRNIRE